MAKRFGRTTVTDQPEVTEVMESLVAENEALKRDIAELQNLLTEAREDVRTLREEMEEVRAHIPVRGEYVSSFNEISTSITRFQTRRRRFLRIFELITIPRVGDPRLDKTSAQFPPLDFNFPYPLRSPWVTELRR